MPNINSRYMSFRYVLNDGYTYQPSVYKLFFGKKYYVWKGKSLQHSVETIAADLARFVARGCKDDHLLKKVVDHIIRSRVMFFRVEVILQTDNVAELLETENLTLAKSKSDPDCLNVKFEGHVSKWMTEDLPAAPVKQPAQNKAISATFINPEVSVAHKVAKTVPMPPKNTTTGKVSLMDALSKLKK